MQFYNVAELEKRENVDGLVIYRYPRNIRESLRLNARVVAGESTGCEIRFVNEDKQKIHISIGAIGADGEISIFKGDYFYGHRKIIAGQMNTIILEEPERFSLVNYEVLNNTSSNFSSNLWRIVFGRGRIVFYDVENFGFSIRQPHKSEVPQKKWLAYGSSITHGSNSIVNSCCYVSHCAKLLGVDVTNRGMAGTCFVENEIADYFANQIEWDFATLELGVNVCRSYTLEEFKSKVVYMVDKLKSTNKPFALISIFPNHITHTIHEQNKFILDNERKFNEILIKIGEKENVSVIDGASIMSDFSYLCVDLLHPSPYGHARMGENLAIKLREMFLSIEKSNTLK